jgi:beta-glucosidase
VEYEHEKYDAVGTLLWQPPGDRAKELAAERAAAIAAARSADAVVIALGLSSRLEGEEMPVKIEGFNRGDRTSLDLPSTQQTLLEDVVRAAGAKPVVLVLLSGSALAVNWADEHVPAILQAWYPGEAGGTAVADVLFGNVNPAGRLPVTFYRSVDQLPRFDDYSMKGRTYRYFTGRPLYAFGHGLGYASFEYSDLKVPSTVRIGTPIVVSITVRNTGAMAAEEVVQVYVTHEGSAQPVPLRALKAFRRVSAKPGESQVLTFTLADRDLSVVGAGGERRVEPGGLIVEVGGRPPGAVRREIGAAKNLLAGRVKLFGPIRRLER